MTLVIDRFKRRVMRRAAPVLATLLTLSGAAAQVPDFGGLSGPESGAGEAEVASPRSLREAFDALPGESEPAARVRLLVENTEAWAARWQVIDQAEKSLDAAYYIFDDDVFTMAMFGSFLKKAIDGVSVRVLVDTNGTPWFSKEARGRQIVKSLARSPNAQVRYYKPLNQGLKNAVARHSFFDAICSNHDKILVGDGRFGITGGRNIATDYMVSPLDKADAYRDTDLIFGDSAGSDGLTQAFTREWVAEDTSDVHQNEYLPNLVQYQTTLILLYKAMDLYLTDELLNETEANRRLTSGPGGDAYREMVARSLLRRTSAWYTDDDASEPYRQGKRFGVSLEKDLENAKYGVATQGVLGYLKTLVGFPRLQGAALRPLEDGMIEGAEIRILDRTSLAKAERGYDELSPNLGRLVTAAQESLSIDNPYVVLTDPALKALTAASDRGVKIRLFTNSPESTDSKITQAYFVQVWPEVLAQLPTLQTYVLAKKRKLHSKSAVIDGTLSLIGTYNLDLVSEAVNSEVVAAIWSPEFAQQHLAAMQADIDRGMAEDPPGVVEYQIEKDPNTGAAVRDSSGQPKILYGPDDHHLKTRVESLLEYGTAKIKLPSMQSIRTRFDQP